MKRQQGLTLVELLIALAISAIIAVVSFRLFSISVETKKSIEQQSDVFLELTRAMAILERDFSQIAPFRPVRNPYGEYNDFLAVTYEGLQLTRNGWAVSPYQTYQRSTLQRVQYRLAPRGSELCEYSADSVTDTPCFVRSFTVHLDDDGSFEWKHQVISEHVTELDWEFLLVDEATGEQNLVSTLPENFDRTQPQSLVIHALSVTLTLDDDRRFKRIIATPSRPYEKSSGAAS
ncbi:type II secretion system minor pseudopilin GspJ [Reinekea marina]|uniref:Type II secretion system protein J n=1 Tax=Reinekea marina TaxID=1310421 RepID=A0ABV7WQ22_9GAMM|nr:type II secretion system minor pseudopilin GspJ [Reinekea marina]MDN3649502.1 type II secretion system minor pseudopilin GspJ [Reinekea marina]